MFHDIIENHVLMEILSHHFFLQQFLNIFLGWEYVDEFFISPLTLQCKESMFLQDIFVVILVKVTEYIIFSGRFRFFLVSGYNVRILVIASLVKIIYISFLDMITECLIFLNIFIRDMRF